jgi:hypothetical protein
MADFQPAASYTGSRRGFVFRRGEQGVGYYLDAPPSDATAAGDDAAATTKRARMEEKKDDADDSGDDDDEQTTSDKETGHPRAPPTIDDILARGDAADVEELTEATVKKLLVQFEKRINRNQMMRAKHAGDPAKFVESEVDLDESLQQLHELASSPQFYPLITKHNSHASILGLLTHENTDICLDVIGLLCVRAQLRACSLSFRFVLCGCVLFSFFYFVCFCALHVRVRACVHGIQR